MSNYIGAIGKKINATVVLDNIHEFEGFVRGSTSYIYTMKDSDGNVIVWKTSSMLAINTVNGEDVDTDFIRKGDTMTITGTVKEHSEYRGTPQTVLTRCKYSLVSHTPTKAEIDAKEAEQQRESLADGDVVIEMPYRQYKSHYSDCETVAGSYNDYDGHERATIKVIIRKGRMKNSGVRWQHFKCYECTADDGAKVTYRAVSEENAIKRATKEHPSRKGWTCTRSYTYRNGYSW